MTPNNTDKLIAELLKTSRELVMLSANQTKQLAALNKQVADLSAEVRFLRQRVSAEIPKTVIEETMKNYK